MTPLDNPIGLEEIMLKTELGIGGFAFVTSEDRTVDGWSPDEALVQIKAYIANEKLALLDKLLSEVRTEGVIKGGNVMMYKSTVEELLQAEIKLIKGEQK